ncbi:lipoprotein [Sphaerisporangium rufum]|uniref:Lipoprotein n=1 Tax=Sphaerisporangium rufum TaxID=1381558 RepID=A0A919UY27_9ACTN|nr:lipoprotein [Sphaerisporangium rufum]
MAAALLALSGCGGGETMDTGSSAVAPALPEAARTQAAPGLASQNAAGGSGSSADRRGADGSATAKTAAEPAEVAAPDRAIIYTGQLRLRVKDVTAAADQAKRIVTAAGGRLDREESTASGPAGGATLVFKIPPAGYPGVLDRLGRELGKRISLRQSTEDVTEQVADVESRLASARATLGQLRELLSRAKTIGEVLSVEREIATRESDLESLQARQKSLAAQTGAATLTVELAGERKPVPKPKEDPPPGFFGGLKSGWQALVTTGRAVLAVAGALLPWLVVAALLWMLSWPVRRLLRRHRPAGRDVRDGAGPPASVGPAAPAAASTPTTPATSATSAAPATSGAGPGEAERRARPDERAGRAEQATGERPPGDRRVAPLDPAAEEPPTPDR